MFSPDSIIFSSRTCQAPDQVTSVTDAVKASLLEMLEMYVLR